MADILTPSPSAELLQRFNINGPRYTSYPTADRFTDAFGPQAYRQALRERASSGREEGGPVGGAAPLSLYVHIPFCESVCYYCACNKVVTRHHGRAAEYLDVLEMELALHLQELGPGHQISQLHLGGGTPTFLSDAELTRVMTTLRQSFHFVADMECSIEVDPRTVSRERLAHLKTLGFNRLSFGVQDFDPKVQQAVHRIQPLEHVAALMRCARELGFASINADLIHGLPGQTLDSMRKTIAQMTALRPDRIALYGYSHMPHRFKPQRRIDAALLPDGGQRIAMLAQALSGFLAQGYVHIGMDHFALPEDALAVAKRQGRLHRNFQGYSTQPDCDLLALGVSSIGKMGATYSQNHKELPDYYAAVRRGEPPITRGWALSREDLARGSIIMALMCQGRVDFESVALAHLLDMREHFKSELAQMQEMQDQGLVTVDEEGISVTPLGWYFVRGVAMVFDQHLQQSRPLSPQSDRYSKVV